MVIRHDFMAMQVLKVLTLVFIRKSVIFVLYSVFRIYAAKLSV